VSLKNDPRPIVQVSSLIIQGIFNEQQFYPRARSGEFTSVLRRGGNRHLKNRPADIPYCTHSQMVSYIDSTGEAVALVHQYLLPDGTIGASGQPDPKLLFLPDRILQYNKELDKNDC
jgi:hypothetical protein